MQVIDSELFLNNTDATTLINGSWGVQDKYYGQVATTSNVDGGIDLSATTSSDAGVHTNDIFDLKRNNYVISIEAKTNHSASNVAILSFSDIPFVNNINETANWPLPNFGTGFNVMLQNPNASVSNYYWLRSTEKPGSTCLNSVRSILTQNERLLITITDGVFTFHRQTTSGSKILLTYGLTNSLSLPLGKYYLGIHAQAYNTKTQSFVLQYNEVTRSPPYSIISELSSNLLSPRSTRQVVTPDTDNAEHPFFICDPHVRYVISKGNAAYNLMLPLPKDDVKDDFTVSIKNVVNHSIDVYIPYPYVWGDHYGNNFYTIGNHKTVTFLYNPSGLLGNWIDVTASEPLKLIHILHETTTIDNPTGNISLTWSGGAGGGGSQSAMS